MLRSRRRTHARACLVLLAAVATFLIVLQPAGASASPGQGAWVRRADSGAATAVKVSPDGRFVYVTGTGFGTIAYDAITGARLWGSPQSRSLGPAAALAVSPDGSRLYETGQSASGDYATASYDATTGSRLWLAEYNGPGNGTDSPSGLGVSPDGTRVYVTGESVGSNGWYGYATVAYDAATGAQVWARRFRGPASSDACAMAIGVSPAGTRVFVTGISGYQRQPPEAAYLTTVAYDAATGARAWTRRYNGPFQLSWGLALAVAPDGSRVYVAGFSEAATTEDDYATIAYDASTGVRVWVRRYTDPTRNDSEVLAVAVSPDGSRVFVTGESMRGTPSLNYDFATIAYDAASGSRIWVRRYNGPASGDDVAFALGVSPDGTRVYVAGYVSSLATGQDYKTIAYDSATGATVWSRRYDGPDHYFDVANAMAVSPDGSHVYVTGESFGPGGIPQYATVAYDTS